ncbi:MAG: virulence factor MviN [Pseudonocardiales bacterium]|nr:MAG: virulence factor MviN [Pseudonocardiales bacterium]
MTPPVRTVAQTAGMIAVITVVARIAGFGRQVVFARAVGPTCVGSIYQTANTLPNILYEIVAGGALASLVVPLLAGAAREGDRVHVDRTTSALLSWALLVLMPVAVAIALVARPLVAVLLAGSRCTGAADLGARLLVVFAPQVILYGVGVVVAGALQAHERFTGPAVAPLFSSVVVVAAYLAYHASAGAAAAATELGRSAELLLSVGTTVGVAALSLPLLLPLRRAGVRVRPTLRFPPGVALRARRLAAAGVAVLAAQQLSIAVALRLANDDTPGGTAVVFTLAQAVFLLPWATLAVPLATSAFPRLSASADSDPRRYGQTTAAASRSVLAVTSIAAAALVAAAVPIARVLVQGVGADADVTTLGRGVAAFAPGLLGYGLVALLSRALYAVHDARAPAVAIVAGWAVTIAADVVLSIALPAVDRVVALAVGNSIGMTLAGGLLVAGAARRRGRECTAGMLRTLVGGVAGGAIGALAGRVVADAIDGGGAVAAIGEGALAAAVAVLIAVTVLLSTAGRELRDVARRVVRRA